MININLGSTDHEEETVGKRCDKVHTAQVQIACLDCIIIIRGPTKYIAVGLLFQPVEDATDSNTDIRC